MSAKGVGAVFARRSVTAVRRPVPVYLASFVVIGVTMTFLGPALGEIRDRTGTSVSAAGSLFAAMAIGGIVASLLAGRLVDRMPGHIVHAGCLLMIAAGMLVMPHLGSLLPALVVFAVLGGASAAIDVVDNALLMWHKGADVGRSMNLMHFSFGVGALAGPAIVAAGLAVVSLATSVVAVVLAAWILVVPSPRRAAVAREEQGDATRAVLIVASVFFLLYVGYEVTFAGWVFTYGEATGLSGAAPTVLVTMFWVLFTGGRLLSAVVVGRVRPRTVMVSSLVLAVVAAVVLISGDGAAWAVWPGTMVLGLALAPQFPVMFAYLERRVHLTGSDTSLFIASAGVGGAVFPFATGAVFDAAGASVVPWVVLVLAIAVAGSFVAIDRRFRH